MAAALALMLLFAAPNGAESRPLLRAEGVITAIEGGTLTVRGVGGDVAVSLNAATTVFVAGRTGGAGDLKVGQTVRGAYERGGVLQWIEVLE